MFSVNVSEAPQTAGRYGFRSIPTTIFLANGQEVHRVEGSMSRADLMAEISRTFAGGAGTAVAASTPSGGIPTVALVVGGLAAAGLAAFLFTR